MPEPLQLTIQRIMRQTTEARLPEMMRNVGENMQLILKGKNVVDLPKNPNVPCLVVGAGPSVERENHLDLLAKANWKFPIITTDRMLIPLLKKGIIPDYVGAVDGHPIISKFYDDSIVDKYADKIKAVMPITISPKTVKHFKGQIYWFIPRMDDFQVDGWISLTKSLAYMCIKSVLVTGGNCGTFCWNLAFYLFHNPIILIGFDLSYDTLDRKKTTYYKALTNYYKGNKKKIKEAIKKGYNPIYKRHFLIDPVFETYRTFMMAYINKVDTTTINCTEGGSLFPQNPSGKPKCMCFKEALEKYGKN